MKLPWRPKAVLTQDQINFWNNNGFLILEKFFPRPRVEEVNQLIEGLIQNPTRFDRVTVDVLHGEWIGKRCYAKDVPPEAFQGPIKINDLFLEQEKVRELVLDRSLSEILTELLGGAPLVCNSLNFLYGSQQPAHYDTWYMPPPVENRLAVTSICLEDVSADAGPLTYYPGSHKLKPYRFSHGGLHAIPEEMGACQMYVQEQLAQSGIQPKTFMGKLGDVFIWHGQLLHGGAPIRDLRQTRKSLVTHYWRAQDLKPEDAIRVHDKGYYYRRDHQAVPA